MEDTSMSGKLKLTLHILYTYILILKIIKVLKNITQMV